MRSIPVIVLALLLISCTSRIAMLQTDKPGEKQYIFIFGRMLLDYEGVKKMTPEMLNANYEAQLNNVLQNDPNTTSCSIVSGTINFGEPGAQGAARVSCNKAVSFQVKEGAFTRSGSPFYIYILSHEQHSK